MMMPGSTVYGTSKRALTYFTKSLAKEVEKTNVKSTSPSSGMVLTDFLIKSIPKDNEKEAIRLRNTYNTLEDKPETVTEFLGK